jgi:hypothetical protein
MRTLTALALLAAPGWAGVRMRAEMTDVRSGVTTAQTMMMDGDRIRIDQASAQGEISTILLADPGNVRILMINRAKNEYYEIDQKTMEQMQQQISGAMAQMQEQLKNMPPEQRAMVEKMMAGKMGQMGQAQARPSTVYTAGGSATMNGFRCTRYEGTRGGQKVTEVCAADPSQLNVSASDFRGFEKLREFSESMRKSMSQMPMAQVAAPDFAEPGFQGFPVHQSHFRDGQLAQKFDLKELQRATFTDTDFSPGNARKVAMTPEGRPRR